MRKYPIYTLFYMLFMASPFIQLKAQPGATGEPEILIRSESTPYIQPVWSPDGRSIAFTSPRNIGIWVADEDGGNIRQITEEAAGFGISWSLDSETILARTSVYENRRRMHAVTVYDIADRSGRRITDLRNSMSALPQWADSDRKIVLITDDSIESFDSGVESSETTRAKSNQSFYVLRSGDIATGMIPENSTQDISPFEDATYINLKLSPDGRKLAFEVYGGNLFVMNIDGTGLVDLGRLSRPSWSPDSEYIVAMRASDDGYNYTQSDLIAISSDATLEINLTENTELVATNPNWSPSGDKIVFDSPVTGNIYVLPISNN